MKLRWKKLRLWLSQTHSIMGKHWDLLYDPNEWGVTIRVLVPVYFRMGFGPFHLVIW
jgi:hypothetical protein